MTELKIYREPEYEMLPIGTKADLEAATADAERYRKGLKRIAQGLMPAEMPRTWAMAYAWAQEEAKRALLDPPKEDK